MDQLIANLANAQHSTGPKSEQGKHRARLNAYRHGLTGQIGLLTAEENEAFELHCAGIRSHCDGFCFHQRAHVQTASGRLEYQ